MVSIAVVGSRTFNNDKLLYEILDYIKFFVVEDFVIVSGGAIGVDTLGERWADDKRRKKLIYKADWSLGRGAGMIRNQTIVNNTNFCVLAFMDYNNPTNGTSNTIGRAMKAGLPVYIISEHSIVLIGDNVLGLESIIVIDKP